MAEAPRKGRKFQGVRLVLASVCAAMVAGCAGATTSSPQSTPGAASGMIVSASGIVTAAQGGFVTKATTFLTDIDYGLVLRNQSSRLAAVGVSVTVIFADAQGHASVPDATLLTGVAAGGTFYFAGTTSTLSLTSQGRFNWTPTRMMVTIAVQRTSSTELVLPSVTNLSITGSLLPKLSGTFNNPYTGQAGRDWGEFFGDGGSLYVVFFDAGGKFVGEDEADLGSLDTTSANGIPPGSSTQFTLATPPPSAGSTARASIDPCSPELGGTLSTSCTALQ